MTVIDAGTTVFAGWEVQQAKDYCKRYGLTMADAVIKEQDGAVYVRLKRRTILQEKS